MNINEIICSRRTIRKFKQVPVLDEKLNKYIEAARIAPSDGNLQPLKYVIVSGDQMRDKVFSTLKWAGYLAPAYNPAEEPKEVSLAEDGSIKYYLEDSVLCVPKRDTDEVLIARY